MLIRFTRADGRLISVNPSFVRSVEPYGSTGADAGKTAIFFGKEDHILVEGDYATITNAISRQSQVD